MVEPQNQKSQSTRSSPYTGVVENEPYLDADTSHTGLSINFSFVEPVIFLAIAYGSIFSLIATNVVEVQYCKFFLNIHNRSVCLNEKSPHFTDMAKFMSTFSMFQAISISVLPALAAIFVGPWSDTFGRRPLMMSGMFGFTMSGTLWTWGHNTNIHPYYFLLFDVPLALGGAGVVIILAAYCYVCDMTTPDTRAFRMGIFFGVINAGTLAGSLVTPYLQDISYTLTLTVGVFIGLVTFLYILLLLPESVSTTEIQRRAISRNPFQWSYVRSIYETCYIRQSSETFWILFYIGLLSMTSSVQVRGEGTVFYIFLQKTFGWTIDEYTHLLSIEVVTSALASCLATSKILALSDLEIISFGIGIRLICALIFSFGAQSWLVYVTEPLRNMGGICNSITRNFVSKIIHSDDLGKAFALLGFWEALAPLIGSPTYNMIFNNTLDTYPKMIFLFSAFLCLLLAVLISRIVHLYFSLLDSQHLLPPTSSINRT